MIIRAIIDTRVTGEPVNIVISPKIVVQIAHYDRQSKLVLAIIIIILILTMIAVLLRVYARIKARIFYYFSNRLYLFSYLLSTTAAGIIFNC